MADTKLTDKSILALAKPATGNAVYWDHIVCGFGVRVTANGHRAFFFNYRNRSRRERRLTIGDCATWNISTARTEAKRLKRMVDVGLDPLEANHEVRDAPDMVDLCRRYDEEHLPKKRARSAEEDRALVRLYVLPALKHRKVSDVSFADVDGLHRKITAQGKPARANRVMSLLSKMFSLSVMWQWRDNNPCKGVERNPENKRDRYLNPAETTRLTNVLAKFPDQDAANAIRLLLFTGCRKGEILQARCSEFDLDAGTWTKPSAHTKQKKNHTVPLSPAAISVLRTMTMDSEFLFPGRYRGHRENLKGTYAKIRKEACIPDVRMHDLRHSFASYGASLGLSLPMIGALLGHTQAQTTQRYAHLMLDPLRQAVGRIGEAISPCGELPEKVARLPRRA
jgi:integrase